MKRPPPRSYCGATGKRRYDSYFQAKYSAREIETTTRENHGRPYRCPHCRGWHLGRLKEN